MCWMGTCSSKVSHLDRAVPERHILILSPTTLEGFQGAVLNLAFWSELMVLLAFRWSLSLSKQMLSKRRQSRDLIMICDIDSLEG